MIYLLFIEFFYSKQCWDYQHPQNDKETRAGIWGWENTLGQVDFQDKRQIKWLSYDCACLLYTSDAADDWLVV